MRTTALRPFYLALAILSCPLAAEAAVVTLAHYGFGEGSGSVTADLTGNHGAASLVGAAAFTPAGVFGGGVRLTGGYVNANASVINATQSFSVAAWVNLAAVGGYETVASQDGTQISRFFLQYNQTLGAFTFGVHQGDNGSQIKVDAVANAAPVAGQWYHLVGVQDTVANTVSLYVNGVRQATSPFAYPATGYEWAATGSTILGAAKWSARVDNVPGTLDEAWFFQGVLSGGEILSLRDANMLPEPALLPVAVAGLLLGNRHTRRRGHTGCASR